MRFVVSLPDRITDDTLGQAYLAGLDRIPWQCQIARDGDELRVERPESDSAGFHIPWPVEGHGRVAVSTASLIERDEPYYLPLELARGKIAQVRNQLADWRMIGLVVPPMLQDRLDEAVGCFSKAATLRYDSEESANLSEQALHTALDVAERLAGCYAEQALAVRHRMVDKLSTFLGGNLGGTLLDDYTAREFLKAFDAGCVPMTWRQVETSEGNCSWGVADKQVQWCQAHKLKVCAGPLLQFNAQSLPDWLYLCEGDFDNLLSFASEFVQNAVTRYRGRVDFWLCAGRISTGEVLSLSEEEKLRLTAQSVELTHSLDPETPILASFDQPWAEFMGRHDVDFPPLHVADVLVRANLGLTGLMLEIPMGFFPGGSLLRDRIEISRQLDHWSTLGMPLYISLCTPSSSTPDPLAQQRSKVLHAGSSPQTQQAWINRIVPMLLAKPYVHGIVWNQLRDYEPHDYPHAGLFDLRRHPKPGLRTLASLRQAHLAKRGG